MVIHHNKHKDKKRKKFGLFCESKAIEYLQKDGYLILEKRFRYKRGEIDIIIQKKKLIVFIEVKGRKNADYGQPESFVTKKQQTLILETSVKYLEKISWYYDIRYDIISITGDAYSYHLVHLEDAFY